MIPQHRRSEKLNSKTAVVFLESELAEALHGVTLLSLPGHPCSAP